MLGQGEWIHTGSQKSSRFLCSECARVVYYPQPNRQKMHFKPRIPYKYCPYCLRKMRFANRTLDEVHYEKNWEKNQVSFVPVDYEKLIDHMSKEIETMGNSCPNVFREALNCIKIQHAEEEWMNGELTK